MSTLFLNAFLYRTVSLAALLAASETQALAFDFTDSSWQSLTGHYGSAYVLDTGTPANNYDSHPYGLITYTSPSLKMTLGPAGTMRFQAHNLCLQSEALNPGTAPWNDSGHGGMTYTANATTDPLGGIAADKLEWSSASYLFQYVPAATINLTFEFSLWMKSVSGTVMVGLCDQNTNAICAVTTTWQKFTFNFTATGGGRIGLDQRPAFYPGVDAVGAIYVWGAQLRRTPSDSTYLATTSAARYALPFEWDSSGTLLGLLVEEARTNLCLYSDDLTNAAWTKSNLTTAKTATGPDGVANSATTITATAANATALQSITSGSAARVTSVWLKRRTGSGNIDITHDNGSTWTTKTITSSWARYDIGPTTAANPTVGIRVVTSGDAVDVALFQHEVGSFPTSAMPTLGSTVTRAVDTISLATSAFPHSATVNTAMVKYRPADVAAAMAALRWDDGTSNERVDIGHSAAAAPQIAVTDGGAAQTAPLTSGSLSANASKKLAAKWKANDFVLSNAGASAATDVSGTLPTVTSLKLGPTLTGHIQQVLIVPADKSTGQVEALAA